MSAVRPPLCLLWGPAGHGVTDYGADVAAAVSRLVPDLAVAEVSDLDGALAAIAARGEDRPRVHLHATDRLLGPTLESAAETVETLAARCALTLTLHDVPQESDGTKLARRIAAYGRFVRAADAVVVNSDHERTLVRAHLPEAPNPAVIPLGARVDTPPAAPDPIPRPRDLVVLVAGFVYPGKGHDDALRAAASAVADLRARGDAVGDAVVRALGSASPGHDGDVETLGALAARLGARFEITGFLSDAEFAAALRGQGIPVAAHQHVSASRSMLDWVEAGRHPLIVDSRYAREMARLRPATGTLYTPPALADLLAAAWTDPSRTWAAPDTVLTPTLTDVAADYLRFWTDQVGR